MRSASSNGGERGGGVVDLVRTVTGLETDAAGLELGEVTLDGSLTELLGGADARFEPLADAGRHDSTTCSRFQERGHGWLRLLGDLGIGAILADDMGLGKTVQAIAMLVSERADGRARRADARRLPDERRAPVGRRGRALRTDLRVHLHHGSDRLADAALVDAVSRTSTSSSRRTTSPRATSRRSPRSTGIACCSTRRRT